ncbi:MAG: translation initiation factor IF-2 [bacterium]|nr:translation initiation factor IF-2 [bacterium]
MAKKKATTPNIVERPPVIVIMGHVDHGKSTLLDFIRKSNVVAGEAGGITQHVSAYEIEHNGKRITFLDTPGHEAFSAMRSRGAAVADIAVLVVAADDSVKKQTLEAKKAIIEAGIPFIVAINKVDKPNANPMKVKQDLAENEVLVENYGGTTPCVEISAKSGSGIPELLDMMLLVAELEELTGDTNAPAVGVVIESKMDDKRGATATIIIKNGTVERGTCIIAGTAYAPVRILEDFSGKTINDASFSSPIVVAGFTEVPPVGSQITTTETKKEAEKICTSQTHTTHQSQARSTALSREQKLVPILLKADVIGTLEATIEQIALLGDELVKPDIIHKDVGDITENDITTISAGISPIVVGFNIKIDRRAKDAAERRGIELKTFDIIYELTQYVKDELGKRRPRLTEEVVIGRVKVIKLFGEMKGRQIIGGVVVEGMLRNKHAVRIIRNENEIGRATVSGLQHGKQPVEEVEMESQFGMLIASKMSIAEGDYLEVIEVVDR